MSGIGRDTLECSLKPLQQHVGADQTQDGCKCQILQDVGEGAFFHCVLLGWVGVCGGFKRLFGGLGDGGAGLSN